VASFNGVASRSSYPSRVRIVEVGPRDGLQNEPNFVSTEAKLEFISGLKRSGLKEIEITSFVSPRWVPQLKDAEQVAAACLTDPSQAADFSVLVPNLKGLERALACGARRIAVFTAASEAFSQKNTNRSIADSLVELRQVAQSALAAGATVRGYVSTCWVCPYQGEVPQDDVLRVSEALLEMGCNEISLGDTVGRAAPLEVAQLLEKLLPRVPADQIALHFHDTQKTALANVLIGLQMGISCFDASAGGLGGCPYAPGATGNLATEPLVYMLDRMGIETGADRQAVLEASARLQADRVSEVVA
jgi:hydroxymethylglutaryl-CoA lyase